MRKLFDEYTWHARILPTLLGSVPFVFLSTLVPIDVFWIKALSTSFFTFAFVYFSMTFFVRLPAKIYEDWLFLNGLKMPTTNLLLFKDPEYSNDIKMNIRAQIKRDFKIELPSKSSEMRDEDGSRKKIRDVVKLMIKKVQNGHLLSKHNYEYGFTRNFWSASVFGLMGSIILTIVAVSGDISVFEFVGYVLCALFSLYILFGYLIIRYTGKLYAKKLIEEYYES